VLREKESGGEVVEQLLSQLGSKFESHPARQRLSVFVGTATGSSFDSTWQQALKSAQRC
jgi:hypothetical protein